MKKNLFFPAAGSVIMFLILRWQGSSLKTIGSPRAIIDLEFADSQSRLSGLLSMWDLQVARTNIWLDFLFIIAYTIFLSMASQRCAEKWPVDSVPAKAGFFFSKLAFLAGMFDIAENLLMFQSIAGNATNESLQITVYCASLKFMIAAVIVLYLVASLPFIIRKK